MRASSKLNSVEVLISKALINSNFNPDEFALTNNVMKKFYDIKDKLKFPVSDKSLNYI